MIEKASGGSLRPAVSDEGALGRVAFGAAGAVKVKPMRRVVAPAVMLAIAVLAVAVRTQPVLSESPDQRVEGPPLAQSLVADGRAMEYVRGLTAIGPRLTGSASYERAADWAASELRAAGIERVGFEPFSIPDGWERERASARLVAPIQRPVPIAALGWTPAPAGGEIEAEIVTLNDVAPEKVAAQHSLAGRIVLLPAGDAGGNPATQATRRRALDAALRAAGVRANLSADFDRDNSLSARDRTFGASVGALPAAQIGRDDAAPIRELRDRGPGRSAY